MDAIEALKTRRTVRVYQDRPVAKAVLEDLVDCARLSPTAMNYQPWEFVVVTDAGMRKKLYSLITHAPQLAQAPACIAVFCQGSNQWHLEDGSAATMGLLVAAQAHGLGSCWVGGHGQAYYDAVRAVLGVPASLKLISIVTVGYAGETPNPDKRSLKSLLHWERF